MRRVLDVCAVAIIFAGMWAIAQKPATPPVSSLPQLSTADKVAIQSFQKTQQDAAKTWNDTEQEKLTVLREWQMDHPGFHIKYNPQNQSDPQNFTVEADAKPSVKPEAKPTEPSKTPDTQKN